MKSRDKRAKGNAREEAAAAKPPAPLPPAPPPLASSAESSSSEPQDLTGESVAKTWLAGRQEVFISGIKDVMAKSLRKLEYTDDLKEREKVVTRVVTMFAKLLFRSRSSIEDKLKESIRRYNSIEKRRMD